MQLLQLAPVQFDGMLFDVLVYLIDFLPEQTSMWNLGVGIAGLGDLLFLLDARHFEALVSIDFSFLEPLREEEGSVRHRRKRPHLGDFNLVWDDRSVLQVMTGIHPCSWLVLRSSLHEGDVGLGLPPAHRAGGGAMADRRIMVGWSCPGWGSVDGPRGCVSSRPKLVEWLIQQLGEASLHCIRQNVSTVCWCDRLILRHRRRLVEPTLHWRLRERCVRRLMRRRHSGGLVLLREDGRLLCLDIRRVGHLHTRGVLSSRDDVRR